MLTVFFALLSVALGVALAISYRKSRIQQQAQVALSSKGRLGTRGANAEREALRLGRILASIPDGIMVVEDEDVVYANPAASRLLGGDPVRIVPTIRTSPRSTFLLTVHHPVYREVRCTKTMLEGTSQLVVVRDVTEARRLDRMRQDFVANASHELKTPVAAISAITETLPQAVEDDLENARKFVHKLGKEAVRLNDIVQDLLDLTRLDHASGDTSEAADVATAIQDVMQDPNLNTEGLTIEIDAADGIRVPARATDLQLAIRNLLDNAVRHTSDGGKISIKAIVDEHSARIEVRDNGEGIPAKDLPRIFERFYRVDRARSRNTGGTGLGLAIVKHVADSAGGSVKAASTYGEGATFTMRLPLAD